MQKHACSIEITQQVMKAWQEGSLHSAVNYLKAILLVEKKSCFFFFKLTILFSTTLPNQKSQVS